ncbi:MAG: hypothetical protein AAB371_01440 [Patescibacteria group bacterium]
MGISYLTGVILATRDDIVVTFGGPITKGPHKGKYWGWITFGEEDHHRPLIDGGPFDSSELAIECMQGVVDACRKHRAELTGEVVILLGDSAPIVEEIITLSRAQA